MNFSALITLLRKKHKLTQVDLSNKSKITQGAICKIERGYKPRIDTANALLKALGYKFKVVKDK